MAFGEMVIMWPVALFWSSLWWSACPGSWPSVSVTPGVDKPVFVILAISCMIVCLMCPMMSLVATILFKNPGSQIVAVWLQTAAMNFPMALCWQVFFAGPLVRLVFRVLFRRTKRLRSTHETMNSGGRVTSQGSRPLSVYGAGLTIPLQPDIFNYIIKV